MRSNGLAAATVSELSAHARHPASHAASAPMFSHSRGVSLFIPKQRLDRPRSTNNLIHVGGTYPIGWGPIFRHHTSLRGVINGGGVQTLGSKVTVEPLETTESYRTRSGVNELRPLCRGN